MSKSGTTSRYLAIYLNDHMGGANAGVDLAHRGAKNNEGTPLGRTFGELAGEIEDDRDALGRLMSELGVSRQRYKAVMAKVGEKLGRFKPNGRLSGQSPLSPLIELEGLSLGIEGKASLWRSLAAAGIRPESCDLAELQHRAESQRERLEAHRAEVAAAAGKAEA